MPSAVGVPAIESVVPAATPRSKPFGSVPAETDHVPPVDVNVPEAYAVPTAALGSVAGVMAAAEAGVDSPSVIPTTSNADAMPTVTADAHSDLIDRRTLAILVKLLIEIPSLICAMTRSIGTCPHYRLTTGNRVSKRRKCYEWVTAMHPLTKDMECSSVITKHAIRPPGV